MVKWKIFIKKIEDYHLTVSPTLQPLVLYNYNKRNMLE